MGDRYFKNYEPRIDIGMDRVKSMIKNKKTKKKIRQEEKKIDRIQMDGKISKRPLRITKLG